MTTAAHVGNAQPDKRLANARARAALAGATLNVVDDDRGRPAYIVTRGCWTTELADLAAVEAWLDRVAPTARSAT